METHKAPGLPLCGYMIGVAHDPILLMALAHHNSIIEPNKIILPMTYKCAYIVSHDSVTIEDVVSMQHIPEGAEVVQPIDFLKAVNSPFLKAANELQKTKLFEEMFENKFPVFEIMKTSVSNNKVVVHCSPGQGAIYKSRVLCEVPYEGVVGFNYRKTLCVNAPFMPRIILELLKSAYPVIPYPLLEEASSMLMDIASSIEERPKE